MVEEIRKINITQEEAPKKKARRFIFKKLIRPLLIVLALFLIFFLVTMFLVRPVILEAKKTYSLTQETYQAVKNQDLVKAAEKINATEESLMETQKKYRRLLFLKFTPFVSVYYKDGESGLSAGLNGIKAVKVLVDAITPYADILGFQGQGSFMGGTAEDRLVKIIQTLDKVTPKLDEVAVLLEQAQKDLEKISAWRYPKEVRGIKIRENIVEAKNMLGQLALNIEEAKPILKVLPQILGYPNAKNYLVIFQNDGELRATGGFMTAYSVLHLESGKVKPEKSDDIYSLDRAFKSRLSPPEPIKKYLFSTDLKTGIVPYYYLRDMNFSPDFKVSMDTFKQYWDKIPNQYKIDGIITVDTFVLKDLVDTLGPISVPEFGTFTNEPDKRCHNIANIICELEYIVDVPLPGQVANRKQAILGPMMREIILKSMGSPKNLWPKLFSTTLTFLKEKHALLYFNDEEIQKAAEAFGAAGRIKDYEADYLHINDSNFGGAKSNMFTKHEVTQEVEISDSGQVTKTLTLIYENSESIDNCDLERKSSLCLNSILRNYVRIYVPKGSKLTESLGSDVAMTTNEDLGKTYFDGFFTVRGGGGRAKVIVKYELPFKVKQGDNYKLLVQKQPGTLGHKYKIIFGGQEQEFDLRTDKEVKFSF